MDGGALRGEAHSRDGTPIAWFREPGGASERPILLVHGTTADHTTFRVLGPLLATRHLVVSMDRRGRGASGDTLPYAIEREFEDVAAVAAAVADAAGTAVDVFGHSFGGRCVMGAALLTPLIRRVVSYEGVVAPGIGERRPGLLDRLDRLLADDRRAELLEVFLLQGVDFAPDEWRAFRTSPTFPLREAAAHTVVRELRAGSTRASALERYEAIRQPVLQIVGSESPPSFRLGAETLDERLPDGRLVTIEGARHRAHHTHAGALLVAIEAFLGDPPG
jgi:pimeloyl-ACP methyl ester carboxylesterase